MTSAESCGHEHLEMTVEISAALSNLPAVATQDWCSRAAAAVRLVRPGSIASVSIAALGSKGSIVQMEATGTVGTDPLGRTIDGELLHPEHAPGFDWWIGDTELRRETPPMVALLRDLPCVDRWADSPCGRRWSRMGVSDLLVGLAPMTGASPGRRMIIEIGVGGNKPLTSSEGLIIRAVFPLVVRRATLAFGRERSTALTRLTHREQQVLEHLALGKSVKQIAGDLARSPHTVHDHVKSLHRKLNASSRGELIARALGHLATCERKIRMENYRPSVFVQEPEPAPMQSELLSA